MVIYHLEVTCPVCNASATCHDTSRGIAEQQCMRWLNLHLSRLHRARLVIEKET